MDRDRQGERRTEIAIQAERRTEVTRQRERRTEIARQGERDEPSQPGIDMQTSRETDRYS